MDPERQRLTLHIAKHDIITTIRREQEESLKEVEKELNGLWSKWCSSNPGKTEEEVLAMVAFQYAKMYHDIYESSQKREEELLKFIKEYEKKINDVII